MEEDDKLEQIAQSEGRNWKKALNTTFLKP